MRQDKDRIFQLRREGRTYREIQRDTGVSRATLSIWFKDQDWSKHLSSEHSKKNLGSSKERMERMNMVRRLKLQYQYSLAEKEAEKGCETYKKDPLFWSGLMIYAGGGDKITKHQIRLSSCEVYIHRIFLLFAYKYLGFSKDHFRYSLIVYLGVDTREVVANWSKNLDVSESLFYKTHVIQGKEVVKRLQYGTCISIISSTVQKKKLLKWLSMSESERFES
jgi:transposase-like protein